MVFLAVYDFFFVDDDAFCELVEDAGVEFLKVGVFLYQVGEDLRVHRCRFRGGDAFAQRLRPGFQFVVLRFVLAIHSEVAFLGYLVQRSVLIELVQHLFKLHRI